MADSDAKYTIEVDASQAKVALKEFTEESKKAADSVQKAFETSSKASQQSASGMDTWQKKMKDYSTWMTSLSDQEAQMWERRVKAMSGPQAQQMINQGTFKDSFAFAAETEKQLAPLTDKIKDIKQEMAQIPAVAGPAGQAMGESFTTSFIKAELFVEMLKEGLKFLREWTIESAFVAARTETLGVALENVARVNGVSNVTIKEQEGRMINLGITTQESRHALERLVQTQIDVTKASALARVAQDAAVIGNINSSQALERMIHGITTLQPRVLRNIGIFVSMEQEYIKFAKANDRTTEGLTQQEKQQIVLNAVLEQGAKLAGTYEAAMNTVGKQLTSLPRYTEEAQEAIGKKLSGALGLAVAGLITLLKWVKESPEVFLGMATAIITLTVAMVAANAQMAIFSTAKLISGAASMVGALQKMILVMIGVETAATAMGTALTLVFGWGAAIVIIGLLISKIDYFKSSLQKANEITLEQVTAVSGAAKEQREASEALDHAVHIAASAETQTKAYNDALKLLPSAQAEYVKGLKDINEQYAEANRLLKENAKIKGIEGQAIFQTKLEGAIELSEKVKKLMAEREQARVEYERAIAGQKVFHPEVFVTPTGTSITKQQEQSTTDLAQALTNAAKEATKADDALKGMQEELKLMAKQNPQYAATIQQIIEHMGRGKDVVDEFRRALELLNDTAKTVSPLAQLDASIQAMPELIKRSKEFKNLMTQDPAMGARLAKFFDVMPLEQALARAKTVVKGTLDAYRNMNEANKAAGRPEEKIGKESEKALMESAAFIGEQMKAGQEAAKKAKAEFQSIMKEVVGFENRDLTGIDKQVADIEAKYQAIKEHIEKAPITSLLTVKVKQQLLDRAEFEATAQEMRVQFESMFPDIGTMYEKTSKPILDRFAKEQVDHLKMVFEAGKKIDEAKMEYEESLDKTQFQRDEEKIAHKIHLFDVEAQKLVRNAEDEKNVQAMVANYSDLVWGAHFEKRKRWNEEQQKQLRDQIEVLQTEMSYSGRGFGVNQDQMRFQRSLAVEAVQMRQELTKAELAGADATTLDNMKLLDRLKIMKMHQQEWERMYDSIREAAGGVFDAMLSKGKSVFSSLLDWLKSMFMTRLKLMFENTMADIFTPIMAKQAGVQSANKGSGGIFGGLKDMFKLQSPADLGEFGPGGKFGNSTLPWKGLGTQAATDADKMAKQVGTAVAQEGKVVGVELGKVEQVTVTGLAKISAVLEAGLSKIAAALASIKCVCPGGESKGSNMLGNIAGGLLGAIGPVGSGAPSMAAGFAGGGGGIPTTSVNMMSELGPVSGAGSQMMGLGGMQPLGGAANFGLTTPGVSALGSTAAGTGGMMALPEAGMSSNAAASMLSPGVSSLSSTAATGGWATTHGLMGLSFAKLGALMTNPITLAIVGAAIAGIALYKYFHGRQERKFRDEIQRDYAIMVNDMPTLKTIVSIGKSLFGGGYKDHRHEVIMSDQVQGLLINYALKTGQDPSQLPLYQKFYGKGFTTEPTVLEQQRIDAGSTDTSSYIADQTKIRPTNLGAASQAPPVGFQHGGVVPGIDTGMDTVLAKLRPTELVFTPEQRRSLASLSFPSLTDALEPVRDMFTRMASGNSRQSANQGPSVVVNTNITLDPKASQTLMEKGYVSMTRKNSREITKATSKGLQDDYQRRQLSEALYS